MNLLYLMEENFKNLLFYFCFNHGKELREFALIIKLFVVRRVKILKNKPEIITRHLLTQKYRASPPNTFYDLEAYGTH